MSCRNDRQTAAGAELLEARQLLTFNIVLDYTYDTSGFFNDQARRDVLEEVASVYESRITDDFTAITPGGSDSWTAVFNNPSTGAQVNVQNLTIPADTVIIYVGARNLPSGLALGGPGGFSSFATPAFNQNLETRGEAGVVPNGTNDTDFALWGGTISYDNASTWNFSLSPPSAGENDFYSVTLHEMAHVLGFGTSDSFHALVNGNNQFTGSNAVAAFGGPVSMHFDGNGNADDGHWASGTSSLVPGTTTSQETSMDPQVTTGTRKLFTTLDWAALDDLGWDVSAVASPMDYGDAPDSLSGSAVNDYQTRSADNGPSHGIVSGLYIGSTQPDADSGVAQNLTATADDATDTSDEGFTGSDALAAVVNAPNSITVNVTNTTGRVGTLYGWIDFNTDGVFDASELAIVSVPSGSANANVVLNFPASSVTSTATYQTFARFRLSTDTAAASSPTGSASDGEVEDHAITVYSQAAAYDSLPSFNWTATAGATRYELEVNNLTTGQNQVILQSYLTKTSFRPPEALPPGQYSWRYRAFNGTSFLPYSALQKFTIFAKTGAPIVTDPVAVDSQTGADSLPTIAWSPITSATRYELWVDDLTRGISRAIHQTSLTRTSFTPDQSLAAGDYRIWVRAYGTTGALGAWSEPFDFSVQAGGSLAGEVTDPVGTIRRTAPTIAWRPTGAITNRLVVKNRSTGASVIDVSGLTELSYTPTTALAPGEYEAQIFTAGVPAPGGPQTFVIEAVTGGAQLTRPLADSANSAPVFNWTAVTGATRYDLWVDDVTNGVSRFIYSNTLTGTAWQPERALAPGLYRVWVRAYNGFTPIGSWSSPVTFRVTEASDVPAIYSPVNTILNSRPTVAYSAVTGADNYTIVVTQNGSTLQEYNTTNNSIALETTLVPGSYSVTVTANSGGTALGSDTSDFTVGSTTTSLQVYGASGTTGNPRPTFSWPKIDSATRYSIWVNDDTRGIVATVFNSELKTTSFTPDDALLPGNYRVWVRAFVGSVAATPWSPASTLIIAETADAPVVYTPLQNSTDTVTAITWSAVTGAAS
ncbi:MAG: GEVED domain-containing protein [Planctomycetaceae bacterium]